MLQVWAISGNPAARVRFLSCLPLILVCAGCAAHVVPNTPSAARPEHADAAMVPASAQPATTPAAVSAPAQGSTPAPAVAAAQPSAEQAAASEEAESTDGEADEDSGSAVDGFESTEGDETESAVVPPELPRCSTPPTCPTRS